MSLASSSCPWGLHPTTGLLTMRDLELGQLQCCACPEESWVRTLVALCLPLRTVQVWVCVCVWSVVSGCKLSLRMREGKSHEDQAQQ